MLFNSLDYLLLLFISVPLYWATPNIAVRQLVLLIASAIFYVSWSGIFYIMLLTTVLTHWMIGLYLDRKNGLALLRFGIVGTLGLLAYFKYANFFMENIIAIADATGIAMEQQRFNVIIPLGISFYVFQLIAYSVDVFRGHVEHERNPLKFTLFVTFFPQLIAGPICRAPELLPQLQERQIFSSNQLFDGAFFILGGFVLKACIADGIAPYVDVVFEKPSDYSGLDNLLVCIGFGVQIFCDFCGYSLMALGSALLFGYKLPFNFNTPYNSLSIQEFWQRWHITLSHWLRDYLYILLGGNRGKYKILTYRNLMLTMLLGGLWHGANWTFVIWGAIHGTALAVHRWYSNHPGLMPLKVIFGQKFIAWFCTMFIAFFAWIFFRAPSVQSAWEIISIIGTWSDNWVHMSIKPQFVELILLFIPLHLFIHHYTFKESISEIHIVKTSLAIPALALFALIYYVDGTEFIYFQF